jgi:DNA-binding CsgD family transcriptional regulator
MLRERTLVGRSKQMDTLCASLERAGSGCGQMILIEGEAGIGKSRLLAEALRTAEKRGFRVLVGAAQELEVRPFGPLADALHLRHVSPDPTRVAIVPLFPAHDGPDAPRFLGVAEERFRVFDHVIDLLEAMTTERPVALALEDLHWSDAATLGAVSFLGRRLADLPILLVATFRPFPRSPELNRVIEHLLSAGAAHLTLGALDSVAIAAIVDELLQRPAGPRLQAELGRAGGNPLFALEFVQALKEEGGIVLEDGCTEVSDLKLPGTLQQVILRRLSFLSPDTLALLRFGSVLGTEFSVQALAAMSNRPLADSVPAFKEAADARVLGESGSRMVFRHDLIREAIYQELPRPLRMGLHREAAQALSAVGAPSVEVAKHLFVGATPGDAQAVGWLQQAARETSARAPGATVELLQRALELLEPSDPRYAGLLVDLIPALAWSGRVEDAEAIGRDALVMPRSPRLQAALGRNVAGALLLAGRMHEARQELERVASHPALEGQERAQLLAEAAVGALQCGDLGGAESLAHQAAELGEQFRDDAAACLGLCTRSWVANLRGFFPESVHLAEAAVDRSSRSQSVEATRRNPHLFLSIVLMMSDRVVDAEGALRTGRRLSEQVGTVWGLPPFHWAFALRHFLCGDWDDAVTEVEAGLALAEEFGSRLGKVWPHSILANIAVHRDDLPAAERELAEAERALAETGVQFGIDWMMWGRALLEEAQGNASSALSLLEGAWELDSALGIVSEYPRLGPDLVRLAQAAGKVERARSVTEALEEVAGRMEAATAHGAALRCRGLLENDPTVLLRSVELYRRSPRPIELGFACEDAGMALASAGRRAEGLALLGEALEAYEQVSALRDAARVTAALRLLGARRGRRGVRSRPAMGWESLTVTEQKVVGLVVEGLPNAEIARRLYVSRYTVETHLKHVFAKLGISSRVELAVDAARRSVSVRSA